MLTLAIDTATAACSIALFDGDVLIGHCHDVVGRGHAEHLIPMIATLPNGGRADTILVGTGPGSFTGLRVGIAAAKGLAFAWDVPAYGFSTLSLIAAQWFQDSEADDVLVVNEGGHGEVFAQRFFRDDRCLPFQSITPDQLSGQIDGRDHLVGSAAQTLSNLGNVASSTTLLPDARFVMHLKPLDRSQSAKPIYGRGADAKPLRA